LLFLGSHEFHPPAAPTDRMGRPSGLRR
jgi:hypothetical protein